jgi:hypothetical protein
MNLLQLLKKPIVMVALFFTVLTAAMTFPLVFRMSSCIAGFQSTDEPYAGLWNFWWMKYSLQNSLPFSPCGWIGVPYGVTVTGSPYPLWEFINRWLTVLTNNVFAFNTEVLLSFLLAALFMYWLAYYILKQRMASVFAAVVFAFCPYHFVRSWQHLGLAQIQWLPLYVLALIRLKDVPSVKNALLLSGAFILVASFDFYYAYFAIIVTALVILFVTVKSVVHKVNLKAVRKFVMMVLLSFAVSVIFLLPVLILIAQIGMSQHAKSPSVFNAFQRPFDDLFTQSARPLSYLLPPTTHPLFGGFTLQLIGQSIYGTSLTEHALFLGWVPLFLAGYAIKKRRGQGKKSPSVVALSTEMKNREFYFSLFVFLAIALWLFSQPPWWRWGWLKIYMPSFFMYKLVPMFRAYSRVGLLVMMAVAVLAGFGLTMILERKKGLRRIATFAFFLGLVLFEFWNYPPYKVIDVSHMPSVYDWLDSQPGTFTIAEYPLDTQSTNELYKFYQTRHKKKIINGLNVGMVGHETLAALKNLSEQSTVQALATLGVRYCIVHEDGYLVTGLKEEKEQLDTIHRNPSLTLIRRFAPEECLGKAVLCLRKTGPIEVYEIHSQRDDHVTDRIDK